MGSYLMRRVIGMVPLFLGIVVLSFAVMHLAPGTPTDTQLALNPKVSLEARERLERLYGFDQPLWIQFVRWVTRVLRLDFGSSFLDGRPVVTLIAERLHITLGLNLLSLGLILLIAVPIGVAAGVRPHSLFDHATTLLVFIGFSVPTFWLALLLMSFFGVQLGWLPVLGLTSPVHDELSWGGRVWDTVHHLILPVSVSAFGGLAGISRYMRGSMLEVMRADYIRTARAKGLPESRVIYTHGVRNALLPIITILGLSVPGLIGGSVIFETIFAIPGMGRLFFTSVMSRDYSVIMGILVMGSALTLLGNFLADLAYAWADPRIRYEERA